MKLWLTLATGTLAACATFSPAQTITPATAPLPALLYRVSSVFVASGGDQSNEDCLRAYNTFYAGLGLLQRFKLVDDPSNADIVAELHYEIDLGASLVSDHNRKSSRQFRVVLLDPKTHVAVWSLTEHSNYAVFQKNRDKDLTEAIAALVHDFSMTVSDSPPPDIKSPGPNRVQNIP